MNDKYIYIGVGIFLVIAFLILWFMRIRKKHEALIPRKTLPKHDTTKPEWFSEKGLNKTIWKVTDAEIQYPGSVQCTAYSLQEFMQSPPLSLSSVPNVEQLFLEIRDRDDQKDSQFGLNPIGALKYLEEKGYGKQVGWFGKLQRLFGFNHSFFNFTSEAQLVEYIQTYAPVMAGMPVTTNPRINEQGVLYAMEGQFAFGHSVYIYGVDKDFLCPDGSRGAYKVRWHYDWLGLTEGWMPFKLLGELMPQNFCYGIELNK